jgi:hypothetical protein
MKKYLMTGVAALAFAATFTSCSKTDLYDENKVEEQKVASVTEKYDAAFIQAFGQPAANQDWGFGSRQLPASFGSKTRGCNNDGNLWYQKYQRPTNVTQEEIDWAKEEFGKVRLNATHTEQITWENYWVQQVYQGQRGSKDGNNNTVYPKDVLNELIVWRYDLNVTNWYPYEFEYKSQGQYEHVNNFNNANNTTVYTDDVTKEKFVGTTLMENMRSDGRNEQFGAHNTKDSKFHYDYIVLEHNGSYFIGFDIVGYHPIGQDANVNMDVDRDWIFDDWIVKISPAKKVGETDPKEYKVRIICEDLMANASSDFDFNDVVFDVNYVENINKTNITIKAAGGTIPLYIEGNEVHKLFQDAYPDAGIVLPAEGVKGTMINTHATGGVDVGDVSLTLNSVIAPKDIKITIMTSDGTPIELKAEVGHPAAKVAVDPNFQWLDERDDITKKYPDFSTYVKNGNINWY